MKYVALLRGINVGGNKKVAMSELKKIFEKMGFDDVSTYINSGNVMFSSKKNATKMAKQIEIAIEKAVGFDVGVLVRDAKNIQKLSKAIPKNYANDDKQRTDVIFLWDAYDSKTSLKKIKTTIGVDRLQYMLGAIIWNMDRKDYKKSSMHNFIGTEIYKNMTARNLNTVRKLASLLQ